MPDSTKQTVWKFMRAVHAPVSTFNAGDSEFYFKKLQVLNEVGFVEVISLIETMQLKNVNIFIAAQAKAAQVIAYPYTRIYKKPDEEINCGKKRQNNLAGLKYGCAFTSNHTIFKENAVFFDAEKCAQQQNNNTKNIEFDLPVNFKSDDNSQSILYVFNIGNSGSALESLNIGKASNGYLIWERSIVSTRQVLNNTEQTSYKFGFANFAISKDYVDVEFYEMEGKNETGRTALFSIAERVMPDQSIINTAIDEYFCSADTGKK